MNLIKPVHLSDVFEIAEDNTEWHERDGEAPYLRFASGHTPNRDRATFHTHARSMVLKSSFQSDLENGRGLYCLALGGFSESDLPPAFYVGIAAGEVIQTRLKKHRVKLTGAHVGNENGTGGVHHPRAWQNYALARATARANEQLNIPDTLSDARLIYSTPTTLENIGVDFKEDLETHETAIVLNHNGIRDSLYNLLWPERGSAEPKLLTTSYRRNRDVSDVAFTLL